MMDWIALCRVMERMGHPAHLLLGLMLVIAFLVAPGTRWLLAGICVVCVACIGMLYRAYKEGVARVRRNRRCISCIGTASLYR